MADIRPRAGYYDVHVGNIGHVYSGDSMEEAQANYDIYVQQSKAGTGRAAGESVTLLEKDEIVREYIGALDMDTED